MIQNQLAIATPHHCIQHSVGEPHASCERLNPQINKY